MPLAGFGAYRGARFMKRALCTLGMLGVTVLFLFGSHSYITRPLGYETLSGWERTILKKFSGELLPVSFEKATHYLLVPAREKIAQYGYPKNRNGQTFGPDLKEESALDAPALLLAVGVGGVTGYLDASQILSASSPDSLDEYYHQTSDRHAAPLYLQDGETVIGEFYTFSYIPDGYDK